MPFTWLLFCVLQTLVISQVVDLSIGPAYSGIQHGHKTTHASSHVYVTMCTCVHVYVCEPFTHYQNRSKPTCPRSIQLLPKSDICDSSHPFMPTSSKAARNHHTVLAHLTSFVILHNWYRRHNNTYNNSYV